MLKLFPNINEYRLYGIINLILFILLFAGGISIMFLGGFSVIPRYLISIGLLLSIFCFRFLYWSIYFFIQYGKIIGINETSKKWHRRISIMSLD